MKNTFASDTPEWQLFENLRTSESLANSYAIEAQELLRKSEAQRERADKYRAALAKLTGGVRHDAE